MLNLCWRPSRPKTDADDAGDAFDFPFRGLFQDHLTRGPKHRKNRCFLNPTRRIHRKLQHHQWPGGGSGVGRRLGGGCPITFGYQPKASGSATGPVGRRPDLRADAPMPPTPVGNGFIEELFMYDSRLDNQRWHLHFCVVDQAANRLWHFWSRGLAADLLTSYDTLSTLWDIMFLCAAEGASRTYKKRGFCSWGLQFAPRSGFSVKRCVQNQKKSGFCSWGLQFAPRIGFEMHLALAWRAQGDRFWTCVGVVFSVKRCVQNL